MIDYKRFFESSFDLMVLVNRTSFLDVNDTFLATFEVDREEALSRPILSFVHPDERKDAAAMLREPWAPHENPRHSYENRFITKNGRTIWLRWRAHQECESGVVHCVATDITQQKTIENQLGRYVIDLRKTATEAQRAKEEAEALAYAASHDLQEPLRTISNWAGFLREDYGALLPPEGIEQLGYITDAAKRGRELVMDLLALSRVGRSTKFEWVDVDNLVDQAVLDMEFAVRDSGAVITRDALPRTWADPSMMRLLLKNLLSNAVKFAKTGVPPHVHVAGFAEGDGWHFVVRDDGIGMDPQYAALVFRVFKRLDQSRPGTGIGLAICQKVVSLHEGKIWIDSRPGEGATVHFTVGRQNHTATDDDERTNQAHPAGRGSPTGRPLSPAGHAAHGSSAPPSYRLGRVGGAAVLAAHGTLRDRPSGRPGAPRPQPSQGLRLRGAGGGKV